MLFGFGLFFLGLSFSTVFFFLSNFVVEGDYIGHEFYANIDENLLFGGLYFINHNYKVFLSLAITSLFLGILSFIFIFERIHQKVFRPDSYKKPKYFMTITNIILLIIAIMNVDFAIFVFLLDSWIITLIFLWISLQSTKELQVVSVFILIGSNLSFFAANYLAGANIFGIDPFAPPLIIIIGSILVISPFYLNVEKILEKKPLFHWSFLITIHAIMLGSVFLTIRFTVLPFYLTIFFVLQNIALFGLMIGFGVLQKINKKHPKVLTHLERWKEDKPEIQRIFGGFTKPKQLTEEEVSVAKEKRICLVCKNKLEKKMYICPECNTFYCNKCSDTLSTLENACWVCDAPFDETKPVQMKDETEDIVDIEDTSKEKDKGKGESKSNK
jgi:hypothetical protein